MAFSRGPVSDNISRGRAGRTRAAHPDRRARPPATRNATPVGPTPRRRYDVAYGIRRRGRSGGRSSPSSRRGTVACTVSASRTGAINKSCLPSGTPSPTDQSIGTGDGATTAFPAGEALPPRERNPGTARHREAGRRQRAHCAVGRRAALRLVASTPPLAS